MYYAGLDIHQKFIYATIVDRKGKIIRQTRVTTSEPGLDALFRRLRSKIKVVIESCGIWLNIYESLEQRGYKVCLANPLKLKAIASAKIKNDKVDSETLAQLLRANLIPETYIPTKRIREFRDIVRHRAGLVKLRKTVKNKVHAILRIGGIKHTYNNLFAQRARSFLENLKDEKINSLLTIFDSLSKEIKEYDNKTRQKCMMNEEASLLKTMPGISDLSALILLSEIGDIKRFSTPRQLCSYAGLVPSQNQSGDKDYRGHITKQGSKWIRWILIQCANITIQYPGRIQLYFYRLKKRKHRNVAITATARKMLYYIWFILTNKEPYRDNIYASGLGTSIKT